MSTRFWSRRRLLIGFAIVALSIGIVFASIPFLPATQVPHTTVQVPKTVIISPTSMSRPGYGGLQVPLTSGQNFWVAVNVTGGVASFCAITDSAYQSWVSSYTSNYYPLTSNICLVGPTQQESQDTLKFVANSSTTWWIVALNSGSSSITVVYQQA